MLTELEAAPFATAQAEELAAHLRLPEGFASGEAEALERYARAAMAVVEGLTGKALVSRRFKWTVTAWRDAGRERMPIAPVAQVNALTLVDADGAWQAVDASAYVLVPDALRPILAGAGRGSLPAIPSDGVAEVEIVAGFGAWADVPAELRQAVLLLAAQYYEQRHVAADLVSEAPMGVQALVARHRELRL